LDPPSTTRIGTQGPRGGRLHRLCRLHLCRVFVGNNAAGIWRQFCARNYILKTIIIIGLAGGMFCSLQRMPPRPLRLACAARRRRTPSSSTSSSRRRFCQFGISAKLPTEDNDELQTNDKKNIKRVIGHLVSLACVARPRSSLNSRPMM